VWRGALWLKDGASATELWANPFHAARLNLHASGPETGPGLWAVCAILWVVFSSLYLMSGRPTPWPQRRCILRYLAARVKVKTRSVVMTSPSVIRGSSNGVRGQTVIGAGPTLADCQDASKSEERPCAYRRGRSLTRADFKSQPPVPRMVSLTVQSHGKKRRLYGTPEEVVSLFAQPPNFAAVHTEGSLA
jgi:hypothetical protein